MKRLWQGLWLTLIAASCAAATDCPEDVPRGVLGMTVAIVNEELFVSGVFAGSPADQAGIRSQDILTAVDGTSVHGLDLKTALSRLRGEVGTAVTLTITRRGQEKPLTVNLTRVDLAGLYRDRLLQPTNTFLWLEQGVEPDTETRIRKFALSKTNQYSASVSSPHAAVVTHTNVSVNIVSIKPAAKVRLKAGEPLVISVAYQIKSAKWNIWVEPGPTLPIGVAVKNQDHGFNIQITGSQTQQGTGVLERSITYGYTPQFDKFGVADKSFIPEVSIREIKVVALNAETKEIVTLLQQPVEVTWEVSKE